MSKRRRSTSESSAGSASDNDNTGKEPQSKNPRIQPTCDVTSCKTKHAQVVEWPCAKQHLVCVDHLLGAIKDGTGWVNGATSAPGVDLQVHACCPVCDDKPKSLVKIDKFGLALFKPTNPQWVRAFDDGEQHPCALCAQQYSCQDLATHFRQCDNLSKISCHECKTPLAPNELLGHGKTCLSRRARQAALELSVAFHHLSQQQDIIGHIFGPKSLDKLDEKYANKLREDFVSGMEYFTDLAKRGPSPEKATIVAFLFAQAQAEDLSGVKELLETGNVAAYEARVEHEARQKEETADKAFADSLLVDE